MALLLRFQKKRKVDRKKVVFPQAMTFIPVLEHADNMGKNLSPVLWGCRTLNELAMKLLQSVQQKTAVKIDSGLKKKVKAMAEKEDHDFQEAYRTITEYAKTIDAADNDYFVQPMQCYTAAWCATKSP